jgi:hypothetical protein
VVALHTVSGSVCIPGTRNMSLNKSGIRFSMTAGTCRTKVLTVIIEI